MWSIIAASVVDLPEPVVPVQRTSPRCSRQIFSRTGGRSRSRIVRMRAGMTRSTRPTVPRCWKMLQRNRPEVRHRVGDVDLEVVLELFLLARGHDRERHRDRVLLHQAARVGQPDELAVDADDGKGADFQVQVRRLALDRHLEQIVDVHELSLFWALSLRRSPAGKHNPGRERATPDTKAPEAAVRVRLRTVRLTRCDPNPRLSARQTLASTGTGVSQP